MSLPNCSSIMSTVHSDQRVPFSICFGILSVIATIFNGLVLFLFCVYKVLRVTSNKFLVSLALGDIIVGAVLGPISIAQLMMNSENHICLINTLGRLLTALMAISGTTLGLIAYDRYLQVSSYERYCTRMGKCKIYCMIILPWFSPFILLVTKLVGKLVNTVTVLICVFSVYTVLVVCYWRLVIALRTKVYDTSTMDTVQIERLKLRNKNVVKFVGRIVFAAIICIIPLLLNRVLMFVNLLKGDDWWFYVQHKPLLTTVGRLFFTLNSCINPALYFYSHPGFRNAFIQMILQTMPKHFRFQEHLT